jgi:hypothetical protein
MPTRHYAASSKEELIRIARGLDLNGLGNALERVLVGRVGSFRLAHRKDEGPDEQLMLHRVFRGKLIRVAIISKEKGIREF